MYCLSSSGTDTSVHPAVNGYLELFKAGKVKRRRRKELATLPHNAVALCMCFCKAHHLRYKL